MSHEATNWAFQQQLSPPTKMVLLALANCHNPSHGCFPSQEYLADASCMSTRNARRHLVALESLGLIERVRVRNEKVQWAKTEYTLHMEKLPDKSAARSGKATGHTGSKLPDTEGQSYRTNCPTNTVIDNRNKNRNTPLTPQRGAGDRFDEFWQVYPKKVAKQAVLKKWQILLKQGKEPETLISAAKTYSKHREGENQQYTASPLTWLNQGRWEDELLPKQKEIVPVRTHRSSGTAFIMNQYRERIESK